MKELITAFKFYNYSPRISTRHREKFLAVFRKVLEERIPDLPIIIDLLKVMPDNRILIVDWQGEPIGLLVDSISDTISVGPADITSPPPNVHGIQSRNLRGVCRSGERLVALLDAGIVLQLEDRTGQMSSAGEQASA